jgi:mannose-6-phosphate isomerase-like protein (cupin superfamily)
MTFVVDTSDPAEMKRIKKDRFGHVLESDAFKGLPFGIARAQLTGDMLHHHEKMTEVYMIISGEGNIELDGEPHPIKQGSVIIIRPGVRHRIVSDQVIDFYVITSPPYYPEAEIPDHEE